MDVTVEINRQIEDKGIVTETNQVDEADMRVGDKSRKLLFEERTLLVKA